MDMNSGALAGLVLINILLMTSGQVLVSNTCDKCARDPSSCRRISGLYTVTVLSKGTYNPVVEIPAPACNINITELRSSSNYIAVKTIGDVGIINSHWALGQPGQYYGAGSTFTYDRQSRTCQGGCIHADGPISQAIVVQVLYYDINPGISYEFILPNNVQFKPYDGIVRRTESTGSQSAARTPERRGRQFRTRQPQPSTSRTSEESEFKGEYYPGSVSIRSEGRPEEVAEATGPGPSARRVSANQRASETKRVSYGSHTLGGRGLSYTAYNSARQSQRRTPQTDSSSTSASRRSGRRYPQQNRRLIRKIASPTYRSRSSSSSSSPKSRNAYSRQAQYQSFSAKTSYLNGVTNQQRENNYRRTYDRRNSARRGSTRYRWKISGLTDCSRSCGGGVQKTNVVCVSIGTRTQVVVTPENCENLYRPRVQTVECNANPCEAAWEADEWSACSVTCGYGTQTRKIECRRRFSPTLILRVSADQCGQEDKPAVAQQCNDGFCSEWRTGAWSQCSKECGSGERQRDVNCVDSFNSPIPGNYCAEAAKPSEREQCNSHACRAQWWLSDWSSECTETCGEGYQFRKALCLNDNGDITSESNCDKRDLPQLRKVCEGDSSCPGTWITSSWGKCSARCGRGRRKRTVVCMFLTSTTIQPTNENSCNINLKPDSEETCIETDCPSLWYTSTWSECSVTCGRGYKTRDVKCLDLDNKPSTACQSSLKPESRENCILDSCNLYQRTDGHDEEKEESDESLDSENYERAEESLSEKIDDSVTEEEDFSEEREAEILASLGSIESEASKFENELEENGLSSKSADVASENYEEAEKEEETGTECKDTYYNCLLVIQSRLCIYEYYHKNCCDSCRKSYNY